MNSQVVTFHLSVMTIKRGVLIGSLLANQHMVDPSSKVNISDVMVAFIWFWPFPITVCGLVSHLLG